MSRMRRHGLLVAVAMLVVGLLLVTLRSRSQAGPDSF
jgi:hypothetical protein